MKTHRVKAAKSSAELHRLEAQVGQAGAARLLTQAGLRDAMSVLEVGSGPGFLTARLLALLPTARITALEVSPELAAIAQGEERRSASELRRGFDSK